jgi:bifunctional DNA primase/polymerase-like protein/primase-like protein
MGIFARSQPDYAAHRIATFPVRADKRPMVKNWDKLGLRGSEMLAQKFTEANALGFMCGPRSRVTILDVDTTDEDILANAIKRHGEPVIIVRTGSGKYHALYRHNGERRRIRPWQGLPIDLLGDRGFAVAAPSETDKGVYQFVRGTLDDLDRLEPMRDPPAEPRGKSEKKDSFRPIAGELVIDGARNNTLWRQCMRTVHSCETFDALLDTAREINSTFQPPLGGDEVTQVAASAWKYTTEGKNSRRPLPAVGGAAAHGRGPGRRLPADLPARQPGAGLQVHGGQWTDRGVRLDAASAPGGSQATCRSGLPRPGPGCRARASGAVPMGPLRRRVREIVYLGRFRRRVCEIAHQFSTNKPSRCAPPPPPHSLSVSPCRRRRGGTDSLRRAMPSQLEGTSPCARIAPPA